MTKKKTDKPQDEVDENGVKVGVSWPYGQAEQLSPNFNLSEFHSHDGAEMPWNVYVNIKKLVKNLQKIRDEIGKPIIVNSAYRSPEHNIAVDGRSGSKHLIGQACDFHVVGIEPKELKEIIEKMIVDGKIQQGGLGLYSNFIHYDNRGTKARWTS